MATVETFTLPDVEAWVWAAVGAPGVKSWTVDRTTTGPPDWIGSHLVQIDTRGSSKKAAWDAAETNLRTVQALAGTSYPDGVLSEVDVVTGPFWLPDTNGQPRYVTRVRILAHP